MTIYTAIMPVISHLPVVGPPWILGPDPPLPLYFGDGGICVQVAALWQLMTFYRKPMVRATLASHRSRNWGTVSTEIFPAQNWHNENVLTLDKWNPGSRFFINTYESIRRELPCETPQWWSFGRLQFFSCLWKEKEEHFIPIHLKPVHV